MDDITLLSTVFDCGTRPKQKRARVTDDQKKLMLEFINDNPELITHSSTVESEQALWEKLVLDLNELTPVKSLFCWKTFFNRWKVNVLEKEIDCLSKVDCKLKDFLKKIEYNEVHEKCYFQMKRKSTIEQVDAVMRNIEIKKCELLIEIDKNSIKISHYRNAITRLQEENSDKKRTLKKLGEQKANLHQKRKRLCREENEEEGEADENRCES